MFTPTFPFRLLTGALAATTMLLSACDDDDNDNKNETPKVDTNFALSTVGGAFPNQTTYLQGLPNLDAASVDNSKAVESSSFAALSHYKQAVYLSKFGAPATLTKYTFDAATGQPVEAGRLVVPGANTFSSIQFISDTEAYASVGGGLARLVKFNPTTFVTTGEVDLSKLRKPGAASTFYLGSAVSGTKLFWGVHYFNSAFDPLTDSAYVAVIDLPTGKVDKLLADGRTAAVFNSGQSVSSFYKDVNGDVYVQGNGTDRSPSGVLRIKNGETRFDAGYFFNLRAATGKDCMGLAGFDNGLAFTCRIEDPTDPYEFNGPNYKFYKLDLNARTSAGALPGLPLVFGSSSQLLRRFDDQTILFSVAGAQQNSLWQYKLADGSVSKKMDVTGMPTGLTKLD